MTHSSLCVRATSWRRWRKQPFHPHVSLIAAMRRAPGVGRHRSALRHAERSAVRQRDLVVEATRPAATGHAFHSTCGLSAALVQVIYLTCSVSCTNFTLTWTL